VSVVSSLPEAFSDLEGLAEWALPTERARVAMRCDASPEELRAFYAKMEPRLKDAIDYLEGFALADLKGPEQRLLWLTYSMAEVAFAVEKYDAEGRVPRAIPAARMVPLHDR
jgi:hypothetical protein